MPDRLPSLVLLVGFWVPPVLIGRAAADLVHRSAKDRLSRFEIPADG